jgi:hypothetical protein
LSQRIHKIIKSTGLPVKLSFKSLRSLSGIYKSMKDKDNKWLQSSLIYSIPCKGNVKKKEKCKKKYIGQTRQYAKKRIGNHKSSSNKFLRCKKNKDYTGMLNAVGNSALIKHMMDYNHEFDFDNTSIVQKSISARKLNFLEMFHIQCEDSCNQRSDVKNLSLAYSGLLDSIIGLKNSTGSGHTGNVSHEFPLNTAQL